MVIVGAIDLGLFIDCSQSDGVAKIVEPLNQLDVYQTFDQPPYPELLPLFNHLQQYQHMLSTQKSFLDQKSREFDTIISKIREAMIILDNQGRLVLFNPAVKQLFAFDEGYVGKLFVDLILDEPLTKQIHLTLNGQKAEGMISFRQTQYQVISRPIITQNRVTGVVLLFFDVSDKVQLEMMRREFTTNVNHELRTPLQIMAGYSELLLQNVTDEQQKLFVDKIYKES